MLPDPSTFDASTEFARALLARIGKSQQWIADNSGISRRRLQYIVAGVREVNGTQTRVHLTYPEQFTLECIATAAEALSR